MKLRLLSTAFLIIFNIQVFADEADVEYRQDIMSAIGSTMGSIGKILKGEVSRPDDLAQLAVVLDELSGTVDGLFPEGSEGGDALPEIWENPEDVAAKVSAFQEATAGFREAATTGDMAQVGQAIGSVGRTCKGCHDEYRD